MSDTQRGRQNCAIQDDSIVHAEIGRVIEFESYQVLISEMCFDYNMYNSFTMLKYRFVLLADADPARCYVFLLFFL